MDPGLEVCVHKIMVGEDIELKEWIKMVKVEDEFLMRERKEAREVAKEMAKEIYCAERNKVMKNMFMRPMVGAGQKNASTSTRSPRSTFCLLFPTSTDFLAFQKYCFCDVLSGVHLFPGSPLSKVIMASFASLTIACSQGLHADFEDSALEIHLWDGFTAYRSVVVSCVSQMF